MIIYTYLFFTFFLYIFIYIYFICATKGSLVLTIDFHFSVSYHLSHIQYFTFHRCQY